VADKLVPYGGRRTQRRQTRKDGRIDRGSIVDPDPVQRSLSAGARALPNRREEFTVPTYIMLSTLTPEGVQTVKNNPQRIKEVNKEVEQLGASVKAQWATLGHVDFISVIEAPDEGTMARVSLELGSRGTGRYETLAAIPIDDFIASL
jgi:uncharacterized protein with GYD domain